ncbi:uncharacterized protein BCR38DRAFT_227781 [Pseudomassariella vexata]|uniref:Homeobox domain-containing protein n=1 Tax=Pseudomassariella vexata TaxID=1141098 RepID=A0A1Y2DVX9_9PEZI|nr:uncharacterized protein BCR38DRAFT_227781 [Pseudomassariella vexata]ORY63418.1 hypothetical protein BCR38DRAFT_227781 [Pseudomassariella vexata]
MLYRSVEGMHNMIGSSGMDQDSHLAHDSNMYSNDQWSDMSAYNQMAMSGYGGEYYMPPVTHGLPPESIGNHMPPPPVPQPIQHHHAQYSNQLPPPLIIPTQRSQVPWPSLQTNPSQNYSAPPVAIPPQSAPSQRQQPKLPTLTTSQPRKTLTDDDRRRMCQFAEDNPTVKQTEIGQRFGVERR